MSSSMQLALLRPPSLPTKPPLRHLLPPLRRSGSPPSSVVLGPRCGEAKNARGGRGPNSRRIDISAVIRPKDVRAITRIASSLAVNLLFLAFDGGGAGLERWWPWDASSGAGAGGGLWRRPRWRQGGRGLACLAAAAAAFGWWWESGGARDLGSAAVGMRALVARRSGAAGVPVALGLLFCLALVRSRRRGRRRRGGGFLKWKGWR